MKKGRAIRLATDMMLKVCALAGVLRRATVGLPSHIARFFVARCCIRSPRRAGRRRAKRMRSRVCQSPNSRGPSYRIARWFPARGFLSVAALTRQTRKLYSVRPASGGLSAAAAPPLLLAARCGALSHGPTIAPVFQPVSVRATITKSTTPSPHRAACGPPAAARSATIESAAAVAATRRMSRRK